MRLAVVSDIHAGRLDRAVAAALLEDLARLRPEAVIVAGDLTQRGRRRQLADAAALVRALGPVVLVLPGNHDLPLWDVGRRLVAPRARFERAFGSPPATAVVVGDVAIGAIDTTRRRRSVGGVVDDAACRRIADLGATRATLRLLVSHHPLVADGAPYERARGADDALAAAAGADVDVLVAGHHHDPHVGLAHLAGRAAIAVHTGTATSTRRRRGVPNAYALLHLSAAAISVETRAVVAGAFVVASEAAFTRAAGGGWRA